MGRALTMKNLYDIKHITFDFTGDWLVVYGNPEKCGAWIISGPEKNGKTWGALLLADYLSDNDKVLYISGEEGLSKDFIDACKRAKISYNKDLLHVIPYEPLEDLRVRLTKRKAAKIVFIDNLTIYNDDFKNGQLAKLLRDFPDYLFIFIAHEERNELTTATAKLCRRLAKIIMRVKGLTITVSGRCPGGDLVIDEEKSALYHGQKQTA